MESMLREKACPPFSAGFAEETRSTNSAVSAALGQMSRRLAANFEDSVEIRLAAEMAHCKATKLHAYEVLQVRNNLAGRVDELTKSSKFSDQTKLVEAQSAHRAAVQDFSALQQQVISGMAATQSDASLVTGELVSHALVCQLTAHATSAASLRHLLEAFDGEVAALRAQRADWWRSAAQLTGVRGMAPPGVLAPRTVGHSGTSAAVLPSSPDDTVLDSLKAGPPRSSVPVPGGVPPSWEAVTYHLLPPAPLPPLQGEVVSLVVPRTCEATTGRLGTLVVSNYRLRFFPWRRPGAPPPKIIQGGAMSSTYLPRGLSCGDLAVDTVAVPPVAQLPTASSWAPSAADAPPSAEDSKHSMSMSLIVSATAPHSVTSIPLRSIAQLQVSTTETVLDAQGSGSGRGRMAAGAPPTPQTPRSPTRRTVKASVLSVWCTDLMSAVFNFAHAEHCAQNPLGGEGGVARFGGGAFSDAAFSAAVSDWSAWATTTLPADLVSALGMIGSGGGAGRSVSVSAGRSQLLRLPADKAGASVAKAMESHVWEESPSFALGHRLRPPSVELPLGLAALPNGVLRVAQPSVAQALKGLKGGSTGADGNEKRVAVLRHLVSLWSRTAEGGAGGVNLVDTEGWSLLDMAHELSRLRDGERNLRLAPLNTDYKVSPTYPARVLTPRSVDDSTLLAAAKFRSKARLPAVVWCFGGVTLSRASQPMSGLFGSTNKQDEQLLAALAPMALHEGRWTPPSMPLEGGGHLLVDTPAGAVKVSMGCSLPSYPVDLHVFSEQQWAYPGFNFNQPWEDEKSGAAADSDSDGEVDGDGAAAALKRRQSSEGSSAEWGGASPAPDRGTPAGRRSIFDSLTGGGSARSGKAADTTTAPVRRQSVSARALGDTEGGGAGQASPTTRPRAATASGGGFVPDLGKAMAPGTTLAILDARPRVNAISNRGKGGGSESVARYGSAELAFLGIDNIHAVRDALSRLRASLLSAASAALHSAARVATVGSGGTGAGGGAPVDAELGDSTPQYSGNGLDGVPAEDLPVFLRPRSVTTDSLTLDLRRALVSAGVVPLAAMGRSKRTLAISGEFNGKSSRLLGEFDAAMGGGASAASSGAPLQASAALRALQATLLDRHAHFPLVAFTPLHGTGGEGGGSRQASIASSLPRQGSLAAYGSLEVTGDGSATAAARNQAYMPTPSPIAPPLPPHIANVLATVRNPHRLEWTRLVSTLLKGAVRVARVMASGTSVFVHCSDGWDRTAQLTSLSQMMLDPYYRTLGGFAVLIEKEWCSFGHQFALRTGGGCGTGRTKHKNGKRSPVFLQFVDAVWQLARQYPTAFEFNFAFLAALAEHAYSGRFGTFLFDNEGQRAKAGANRGGGSVSMWTHIARHTFEFRNPWYRLPDTQPTRQYISALWRGSPATARLVDTIGLSAGDTLPGSGPSTPTGAAAGASGRAGQARLDRMSRIRTASSETLVGVTGEAGTLPGDGVSPCDLFNVCATATSSIMVHVADEPGSFALWPQTSRRALALCPLWGLKYCAVVDYPTEDNVPPDVADAASRMSGERPAQHPATVPEVEGGSPGSAAGAADVFDYRANSHGRAPPPLPTRRPSVKLGRDVESTTPSPTVGAAAPARVPVSTLPAAPSAPPSGPPGAASSTQRRLPPVPTRPMPRS